MDGVERARDYLEAFAAGDTEALPDFFTDDIVWRVAGEHDLSGTYQGRDEVIGYFEAVRERTGGTLTIEPQTVLASDQHTAMLARVRAERGDKQMDVRLAQIFKNGPDGRWSEYWALADDQPAVDAFWSGS